MPQATAAKTQPRRRRFIRRKNPAKTVKEWELTRLRKQVKRMMPKPEWKTEDKIATATITTTATVSSLFDPAQGDGESEFIGDSVRARSLLIRMSITPNATAGVNFLRVIIFRDKQCNGVAPTATQLLDSASNYDSPLNTDFGKRFKVMFDRIYTVDTDANGAQVDKIYRKLMFTIDGLDTAGTNPPNTNGMFILAISDQATNGPSFRYNSRVRYTDS